MITVLLIPQIKAVDTVPECGYPADKVCFAVDCPGSWGGACATLPCRKCDILPSWFPYSKCITIIHECAHEHWLFN